MAPIKANMFTGIIQEKGQIKAIKQEKDILSIIISAQEVTKNKKIGDSIAINGICSTVTKIESNSFEVDFMEETMRVTTARNFKVEDIVNLEAAIKAGDSFDGHFVQGHIDAVGKVITAKTIEESKELTIEIPQNLMKFTAIKGSIAINGVSLTISQLTSSQIVVSLIPHTLKVTNFSKLQEGDEVNIELDMIAKYLSSLLDKQADQTNYQFLHERNFI